MELPDDELRVRSPEESVSDPIWMLLGLSSVSYLVGVAVVNRVVNVFSNGRLAVENRIFSRRILTQR